MSEPWGLSCPIPLDRYPRVTLAHGGGGRMTHRLIEDLFLAAFDHPALHARHDSAVLPPVVGPLALSTDAYVVRPLEFPGGDIGRLAVCGTVNDLAMAAARPLYLTLGVILEEGLPMETLWRVVGSIRAAALQAGIAVVAGDTKVVERGRGDGIFLCTAGAGEVMCPGVAPASVRPGDVLLLSGDVGRHGVAVMASREGLAFTTDLVSDCAPLWSPIERLIGAGIAPRCLRDCTRGGLAAAAWEIAEASGTTFFLDEAAIPVDPAVQGACDLLGLSPLRVACEGRFLAVVAPGDAPRALALLAEDAACPCPVRIGVVGPRSEAPVLLKTAFGSVQVLELPSGEQLPRIC